MKPSRIALIIGLILSAVPVFADQNLAGNVTITGGATGNLFVTGYIDSDNNQFTFGTQSTSYGVRLLYTDNSVPAGAVDTLSFLANRSPASWLWLKNTGSVGTPTYANVMRLDGNNQLILFQSNGTTAGVTLTPASNQLSLGTATLTGSGANLTAGGALTVASGVTSSNLSLTSTGHTFFQATPAAGYNTYFDNLLIGSTTMFRTSNAASADTNALGILSNGNVGIGTSGALTKLDVKVATNQHVGIYNNGGTTTLSGLNDVGSLASLKLEGSPLAFGGAGGVEHMRIDSNGNVGIGTTSPGSRKVSIQSSNSINDIGVEITHGRTTGTNYGLAVSTTGLGAGLNQGIFTTARDGTSNFGLRIYNVLATANNYSLYSDSPAQSYFQGNVGIGTASPGTKLEVNGNVSLNYGHLLMVPGAGSVVVDSNAGVYWQSNGAGVGVSDYGLYRTPGAWTANNYQQLMMKFATGIIIDGGVGYGKSGTVIQPNGGNVGIGTSAPVTKLTLQDTQPELSMGLNADPTTYNRFGFNTSYQGYWAQNATWTGTQWNHVVGGGYNGAAVKLQEYYGTFQIDTADAGVTTDPITWNTRFYVANNGNVGIGTTTPSHKLAVNGTIRAKEVIVDTGWADYVFDESYNLAPLSDVEAHIKAKKHLPGIPSAAEIAEHGVSMGDMQSKLLSKIEEITLHQIAQEKAISALQAENATLRQKVSALESTQP